MHLLGEHHILIFLLQVFLLLLLARGFGELLQRRNQPALTAEILVGVLLGPTVLGRFAPEWHQFLFPPDVVQQNMLETVAWLGVLFLLLDTGLEIDFSIAWRRRGSALTIALADIFIPMLFGLAAVAFLPDRYLVHSDQRLAFCLFMATVMTISAMPVAARVLHDLKLLKSDMGFLIMSALAVNDIVGWVLFTMILGVFTRTAVEPGHVALVFVGTIGFSALALTVGRRLSMALFESIKRNRLSEPGASLTATCLLGLLFGAFTQNLGIHALFGFFLAGVVAGEARDLSEDTRRVISQMVHAIFVPLFFANIGLKIDFAASFDAGLVALLCAAGVAGRYAGAWVGVTLSSVPRVNRDLISIAHTPGGMMEVVVALLALESGLITQTVFVAIVFSAIFSSILMGPWMSRALARRAAVRAADFVHRRTVLDHLQAADREEAIRILANRVAEVAGGGAEALLAENALAREREFGTGLGGGIAIPHVRIEGLRNPILGYGRCAEGVEWDAPDGLPAHHIFFLATPAETEDLHVQVLAQIARAMTPPANRQALEAAPSHRDVHQTLIRILSVSSQSPARPRRTRT